MTQAIEPFYSRPAGSLIGEAEALVRRAPAAPALPAPKNPLPPILTALSLLLRGDGPAHAQTVLRRLSHGAQRTLRMIQELLDVRQSRLSGRLAVRPRPVDLAAVAVQVGERFERSHPERTRVRIEGDVSGVLDPDRIAQVLSNLISNGLRYGDPGRAVEVLLRDEDELLVVCVRSDGAAIPAAELELIFEPFRRAKQAAGEGLGIGLYITRQIVRAHGGRVSVRSGAAEGTVFTVTLPRFASSGGARSGGRRC